MPSVDDEFLRILTQAVTDLTEHGYDDVARIEGWLEKLRAALGKALMPQERMEEKLREGLRAIFDKLVEQKRVLDRHPGVAAFTLENVKPELHEELDRRIRASADLIRLNARRRSRRRCGASPGGRRACRRAAPASRPSGRPRWRSSAASPGCRSSSAG